MCIPHALLPILFLFALFASSPMRVSSLKRYRRAPGSHSVYRDDDIGPPPSQLGQPGWNLDDYLIQAVQLAVCAGIEYACLISVDHNLDRFGNAVLVVRVGG